MGEKQVLTKKEWRALRELKRRLMERLGYNLVSIRLFGSKARGRYRKSSDIDLLIIVKEDTRATEDILIDTRLEILDEFDIYDIYPEIVSFSLSRYEYFKNLQVPFLQNVEKEAITI